MSIRAALKAVRDKARQLRTRVKSHPLEGLAWTAPQIDFMQKVGQVGKPVLLRTGNRGGKSHVGAAELIGRCLGKHPLGKPVPPPPIKAIVVCRSNAQSVPIQEKIWNLTPKSEFVEGTKFNRKTGFGGANIVVQFKNGSSIRFVTSQAGPASLMGEEAQVLWVDEPVDYEMWRECERRTVTAGALAAIWLTLTPVNGPIDWLREACESGQIEDCHYRFTPETFLSPITGTPRCLDDGTPMDAAWIAAQRAKIMEKWIPVVLDGEWETRVKGRLFSAWTDSLIKTKAPPKGESTLYYLGVDFAASSRLFGSVGVLVAVEKYKDRDGYKRDRVYILAESCHDGDATMEQQADGYLAMLGDQWEGLTACYSDKPAEGRFVRASGQLLAKEIARRLGKAVDELKPQIRNAKRGQASRGQVDEGEYYLHQLMLRGDLVVHPRCKRMIEAFNLYDGDSRHSHKDMVDALRYALTEKIRGRSIRGMMPTEFRRRAA